MFLPVVTDTLVQMGKRTYQEAFISYGFTILVDKGVEKPQCVLCNKKCKLSAHLVKVHPQKKGETVDFFKERKHRFEIRELMQQENQLAETMQHWKPLFAFPTRLPKKSSLIQLVKS